MKPPGRLAWSIQLGGPEPYAARCGRLLISQRQLVSLYAGCSSKYWAANGWAAIMQAIGFGSMSRTGRRSTQESASLLRQ